MGELFRVVHPYHPLGGQEFQLVTYKHTWGEHRVYFHDQKGELRSLPARWTSVAAKDPFVELSAGRSYLRVEDLLVLVGLVRMLQEQRKGRCPET